MKTIRAGREWKGLALLGVGLGLAVPSGLRAQAQPDPNNAAKGTNPPNRAKRQKGQKGKKGEMNQKAMAKMQERELASAEAVAGKPLTDEQKQKVRDALATRETATRAAREAYVTELAASLGMEPDAVRVKLREATAANRGGAGARVGRRNKGAQGAAAPAGG